MRLSEFREHLERCELPADEGSYRSVGELRNTVLDRIGDRHIRRKQHDARSRSVEAGDLTF